MSDEQSKQIREAIGLCTERPDPPPSFARVVAASREPGQRPERSSLGGRAAWLGALTAIVAAVAIVAARVGGDTLEQAVPSFNSVHQGSPIGQSSTNVPTTSTAGTIGKSGEWTELSGFPLSGRVGPSVVTLGSSLIVVGGGGKDYLCPPEALCDRPQSEPFRDGAAFDSSTGQWRQVADAPQGIYENDSAVAGADAYFLDPESDALLRYRMSSDEWEIVPTPVKADLERLAVTRDRLVAVGLNDSGDRAVWMYDSTRGWQPLPTDPLPDSVADYAIVGVDDGLILLVTPPGESPRVRAAQVDIATHRWHLLPNANVIGLGAWAVDEFVIVDPLVPISARSVHVLDLRTNTWSALPPPPRDTMFPNALVGVIGAQDSDYAFIRTPHASWALDQPSNSWVRIPPVPSDASHDTVVGAGSSESGRGLVVVGGAAWSTADQRGQLLDDAWMWQPPSS